MQPDDEEIFLAERILDQRVERVNGRNRTYYLVKYEGYDVNDSEWLPGDSVGDYHLTQWRKERELLNDLDLEETSLDDGKTDDEVEDDPDAGDDGEDDGEDDGKDDGKDDGIGLPFNQLPDLIVIDDENVDESYAERRDEGTGGDGADAVMEDAGVYSETDRLTSKDSAEGGLGDEKLEASTTDTFETDAASDEAPGAEAPANDMNNQAATANLPTCHIDASPANDDFVPMPLGLQSPDYINEPGPVPTLQDILEHDLNGHFGQPITERQEAVGVRVKGIDGWLPENVLN